MNLITKLSTKELTRKADRIRKDVVDICVRNGAGHIAPSLSIVDVLVSLYYTIMDISPDPSWVNRDRLVFSKAHGCYALYAILSDIGYIQRSEWENFYKGSFLSGCMERNILHGMEVGCGSLGHGLPMAVGIAYGAKLQNKTFRTYCIIGDGEMQEGSNWEAIQFAVKYNLSNLTVIIDNNRLQAMEFLENVLTPAGRKRDLEIKLKAFGFKTAHCDGHKMSRITKILRKWRIAKNKFEKPRVLIADTIKGYGLVCMENVPKFHFRIPTEEELEQGCRYE